MTGATTPPLVIRVATDGALRTPMVAGPDVPVGAIVDAAHEEGIASALARWGGAGLSAASTMAPTGTSGPATIGVRNAPSVATRMTRGGVVAPVMAPACLKSGA